MLLDRQVGSKYFVSAANACKIFFLVKAAVGFIEYTGRDNGNHLDQTLYRKLQDPKELLGLEADAIMFYFVYPDFVMLVMSNEHNKLAYEMTNITCNFSSSNDR